jgi:predicted homoserine dehydrogenase-like protein
LAEGLLPLGLAQGVPLTRAVGEGECLTWEDVSHRADEFAVQVRRDMEAQFGRPNIGAASPT